MTIDFGYGNTIQSVDIPDTNLSAILTSNPVSHKRTGEAAVQYALANPIGTPCLKDIAACKLAGNGGKGLKTVIVTSDITRPLPSYKILPSVLDELYAAGVSPSDITVVIACGSHRPNTADEHRKLVGERCHEEVNVVNSNPDNCVNLGTTAAGTSADFDRLVVDADLRIALGNIEFHYFAGYSGGCKAVMPGVSTPASIQANHSMMASPDAHAGKLEGNPVREDLEEAAAMLGVDFIVNVVLDEHKEIVHAVAGDLVKAHREGCRYLDSMYRVTVDKPADIILVSQGGSPKDITLYQTQKALDNASHIIKDGGTIILIGACTEGMGNTTFEDWLLNAKAPAELLERISKDFCLGGHKAAAIAGVLQKAEVYLVSDLDPELVKNIFFIPAASAQDALGDALKKHGQNARIIAMPYGGSILPSL